DADITPEMDAFATNWARNDVANRFSPEMAARLFGPAPQPPAGTPPMPVPAAPIVAAPAPGGPGPSSERDVQTPSASSRLDISALTGAANQRTPQVGRLDLSKLDVSRETPGLIAGLPGAIKKSATDLYSQFLQSINRSDEEMQEPHTLYAGRLKDI